MDVKILAIIPARGNSKGIRRKNMRLLLGRPLIYYIIKTAQMSNYISDIVVTTEDNNIAYYVKKFGVKVRIRPKELSQDDVTLDPVVYDAYTWYRDNFGNVDYVITLQPTSPLLKSSTLDDAIIYLINSDADTLISVIDDTHLMWRETSDGIKSVFKKRLNRQWLPKTFKETGAFLITKSEFVSPQSRIGKRVEIFEISYDESIDIDKPTDWLIAETIMKRLNILIVTTGNEITGLGHIYRMLTLAEMFIGHNVKFVLINSSNKAYELVNEHGFEIINNVDLKSIPNYAKNFDIVVNDILDTDENYVMALINSGAFVVNFEDLGSGSYKSHVTFNALYEHVYHPQNHLYGYKYVVLREEFLIEEPNTFNSELKNILLSFGGVDQNNLTLKVLRSIIPVVNNDVNLKVILGPSYMWMNDLKEFLKRIEGKNIVVKQSVENMAAEMRNIDLAITSNGRTVYELASMRIPIISIAQNDRETLHTFARYNEGVMYLGIACNVSNDDIRNAVLELINNPIKRRRMYNSLPFLEIRQGSSRVKDEILKRYWRWRENENKDREKNYRQHQAF